MLAYEELQEKIAFVLDLIERDLADEVVSEVMSLSETELEAAARSRGICSNAQFHQARSERVEADFSGEVVQTPSPKDRRKMRILLKYFDRREGPIGPRGAAFQLGGGASKVAARGGSGQRSRRSSVAEYEQLRPVLETLEQTRSTLLASGARETAELVSVAILEIRMKLNPIDDEELKRLCEEMVCDKETSSDLDVQQESAARRMRPLLRLVK